MGVKSETIEEGNASAREVAESLHVRARYSARLRIGLPGSLGATIFMLHGCTNDHLEVVVESPTTDTTHVQSDVGDSTAPETDEANAMDTSSESHIGGLSLDECAGLYRGFETCCAFDSSSSSWVFSETQCPGSAQCSQSVDCPAGFLEIHDNSGGCACHSPLAGTCREDSPIYVFNNAECPSDLNPNVDPPRTLRCPTFWPANGKFTCTNCACERRNSDIAIVEPLDCPEDKDQEGCPCSGQQCCLNGGNGLECINSIWEIFSDGPCVPWSDLPFPGYCRGAGF